MGVQDYIQSQKARFFGSRDLSKLEIQKQELEAQRKRLEVERQTLAEYENARQAVRKEKAQIHELEMAPKRERRAAVLAGLQRFKVATTKANTVFKNVDKSVSRFGPGAPVHERNFVIKPTGIFADTPVKPKTDRPTVVVVRVGK